jgi:acyl-CoA synthetase (AMP-forming)/AMP-acid ligase II
MSQLPLSPVGKILKRELREMITEKLALEARERGAA